MFGKWKKLSVMASASALLFGSAGANALAAGNAGADTAAQPYRIVVLGDSVSVGYEPGVTKESDIYGYADRLFEQALLRGRAEESNFAVLGLTSEGLKNLMEGAKDGTPLTAAKLQDFGSYDSRVTDQANDVAARTKEIGGALADADIVVMTIGGNDFLNDMRTLAETDTPDALAKFNQDIDRKLNNYTANVKAAVETIHELNPSAPIELADQYLPLPKQFDADLYTDLLGVTDELAGRLDDLAKELDGEGVDLNIVHIRDLFVGREMSYTHIYPLNDGDQPDVHPTQAGYEAIAERFSEAIWKGYTPLHSSPKTSNGKTLAPRIYIDGTPLATANEPKLKNGTTFLALSDVAAATGAELAWDNKTKSATFRKNGSEVKITIGSKTIVVNGKSQSLAQPAYFETVGKIPKTYVPLAAIASGLQYQVVYRAKLNTAFIHS